MLPEDTVTEIALLSFIWSLMQIFVKTGIVNLVSKIYFSVRVFDAMEDPKEGGFSKNGHSCYLITLATTGGTIQLLFEDHKRYIMWKSSISHLLCDYLETTTRF